MPKAVKYFEVTSDHLNSPAYYAAYELKDAKEVAYSDYNWRFLMQFTEVPWGTIPKGVIHSAKLDFDDARQLTIDVDNKNRFLSYANI